MSIAQKLTAVAENAPKVYEAGEQAAYDRFWDTFQLNGARTEYHNAFGMGWTQDIFRPKYDIVISGGYGAFINFSYNVPMNLKQALADAGVTLTFPRCYNFGDLFQSSGVTEIGVLDFSTAISKGSAKLFNACNLLKSIDKIILPVGQTTFQSWFSSCTALEHLTIEGTIEANNLDVHWSPLDHESLMSILEALKDYSAVGTTGTVTLGADNLAKLSDGEKAIATQKGWTLV